MKKLILRLLAISAAGLLVPAMAQTTANEPPDAPPPMQGGEEAPPDMPPQSPADDSASGSQNVSVPAVQVYQPNTMSPATPAGAGTPSGTNAPAATAQATAANPDDLRLNFNNVPLDMVLNYLSDAAGFVIIMDTPVHGTVSVISSHPMNRDEAVDLLNSVLNQNGYAAIRNGRTLTIVEKNDAKTRDIPVQVGNDPATIPKNDEIVTQIIPVRYVDASQLVTDLSSFVSPQATIVANQAGNSIVITDTQENIRHLVEIVEAIDSSAAGETEIRVFPLSYANPNDVASELGQVFPSGNSSQSQMPIRFGGGGPGGFFRAMMAASANNNSSNNRAQKQSQVTAVADPRTQSIIVMASKDLMTEIAGMIEQLDTPSTRDQKVYVYHMANGDPQEAMQVLQNMFQSSTSSRGSGSSSSQQSESSALMNRAIQNATTVGNTSESISSGTGTGVGGGRSGGSGGLP